MLALASFWMPLHPLCREAVEKGWLGVITWWERRKCEHVFECDVLICKRSISKLKWGPTLPHKNVLSPCTTVIKEILSWPFKKQSVPSCFYGCEAVEICLYCGNEASLLRWLNCTPHPSRSICIQLMIMSHYCQIDIHHMVLFEVPWEHKKNKRVMRLLSFFSSVQFIMCIFMLLGNQGCLKFATTPKQIWIPDWWESVKGWHFAFDISIIER